MTERTYECMNEECGVIYTIDEPITQKPTVKCSICEQETLEIKIVLWCYSYIKGEPQTVGVQALRNSEKLGHYEREDRKYEQQISKERAKEGMRQELESRLPPGASVVRPNKDYIPPWRKTKEIDTSFRTMSKEKITKFIHTGER